MARMEGVIADKRTDKQGDRISRSRIPWYESGRPGSQYGGVCYNFAFTLYQKCFLKPKRDVEYSVAFHGSQSSYVQ
jgi:hypothetical protein